MTRPGVGLGGFLLLLIIARFELFLEVVDFIVPRWLFIVPLLLARISNVENPSSMGGSSAKTCSFACSAKRKC